YVPGFVDVQIRRRPRHLAIMPLAAEAPVHEEAVPSREEAPSKYDRVQPPPPEPYPAVVKARTVAEFGGSFKPKPGTHETILIHPVSKAPVTVRFSLPTGTPRKVRVHRREVVF